MLKSKIIEVPIANGPEYAEEVVNVELTKIKGTVSSITHLDERRVLVIYEGEDSSSTTGGTTEGGTTGEIISG